MTYKDVLCTTIVREVAKHEEIDPMDLTEPLHNAINVDALGELFRDNTGHVTFEYLDYQITVHSSGQIDVFSLATTGHSG